MFMVPITLFRVPHASLMVPSKLFMVPKPNDHGSTNEIIFCKVPTPNLHSSTKIVQGSIYINVHGSMNIVQVPR